MSKLKHGIKLKAYLVVSRLYEYNKGMMADP